MLVTGLLTGCGSGTTSIAAPRHEHKPGAAPHTQDRPLGYGVGHANVIFAFDTRDRLPVLYPGGARPADIAADLPLLDQGDAQ